MDEPIPVCQPLLNGNEEAYLRECVRTGWISSEGPFVKRLENEVAARVGRRFGAAVCNGTAALETALRALEIGAGEEVIMPSFTIISCALAALRCGARPVFVDSEPLTFNMDVSQVEAKITPRTRAVMPVHIYGLPVHMDPLLELARRHDLKVVEDAAEAIGLTYKGKPCGGFGDISVFSFYANKFVSTGEGGMVLTDDEALAARCRSLRNLCFGAERRFVHEELGFNHRMTNLQAAVGVAQLERLDETIRRKRAMAEIYDRCLEGVPQLRRPPRRMPYAENVYWVYGVVLNEEQPLRAAEVMRRLKERRVETRPFFWPMHRQPVLQKLGLGRDGDCPCAEKLGEFGLYLPNGLGLSDGQIQFVAETLTSIVAG